NLASDYEFEDRQAIMNDIKSVDLDKVIYDEIEFDVDKDVKKYLIDVKEDVLIYKLQDEIEEILFDLEKLKLLYENNGKQMSGSDLPYNLLQKYFLLYLQINCNYIIYDIFVRYKALTEKVFKGLITSYHITEWGIKKFDEFFLTEAILHISAGSLQEILKKEENLDVEDDCIEKLLVKLNNFTSSIFRDGFLGTTYENELVSSQLHYHSFKNRFTNIFTNIFSVFSRLDIAKEQFIGNINSLLKFLKTEKVLAWHHLKEFSQFIIRRGYLFEAKELLEILNIAINGDKYNYNKYTELIETVPKALVKFYPDYKIDNLKLIQRAILNCSSENGEDMNYMNLVDLSNACNDSCKETLFSAFEKQLDEKFNKGFYGSLICNSDYDYNSKNYFQLYSESINQHKGQRAYKFGSLELTDLVFIGYIFVVYQLKVDFKRRELKLLTNLNHFETWLLNPIDFDYSKFNAIWLIDLNHPIILERLKGNVNITKEIELELEREFNAVLAELKYKFFFEKN
ncbi:MAG: hypothetical protein ABI208_05970, partial [Ginsengibacter sp.]